MTGLLSVEEAHARLMALFAPLEPEIVPLAEAAGRVLARDVTADRAQPPFPASAMDGYALRSEDWRRDARLRVVGAALAGQGFAGAVGPGQAVRIFTGAPVPEGADAVLIQEEARQVEDQVTVLADPGGGRNIRPAGADFPAGYRLMAPRRIGSTDMALLAAMNAGSVAVTRRPTVALIATGDELVMPGEQPARDQIVCTNSFGLKAMLARAGAQPRLLPIARDSAESLGAVLDLARGSDLIVTLGGASVGDHDLVAGTARALGMQLAFHKVALRPGKPLLAGRLGTTPLIGLPGNPVSALVCGRLFLVPAIAAMLGLPAGLPPLLPARLAAPVEPNGPRRHYMRARVEAGPQGWICTPFARQDSALLSVLAEANALLVRPPGDPSRDSGDPVEYMWID